MNKELKNIITILKKYYHLLLLKEMIKNLLTYLIILKALFLTIYMLKNTLLKITYQWLLAIQRVRT